jgi:NTE family protein
MSGGGARAAYQIGVLRALARRWPAFQPQIITGVSAGAINAASLAGYPGSFGEALEDLGQLWGGLTTEQVFRTDSPSLLRIGFRWAKRLLSGGEAGQEAHGLVDTEPLQRLLARHLDPNGNGIEGIGANIRAGRLDAFGITATNYATGRSVTWVEGRAVRSWDRPKRRSISTRIGVEHVMASAALPLIFPAVRVGPAWYGDGGIRLTAPLSPALHLGADRILAVSTRYARTAVEAERPAVTGYPPPAQILGVLMNAIFLDLLDQDATTLRRISELTEDLAPDEREGLRPVQLLVIRPSQDLGRLAGDYEPELPPTFRFLMRGLGTRETRSPDWLSMLLFEPDYIRHLIEIGERDAEAQLDEIGVLLGEGTIGEQAEG